MTFKLSRDPALWVATFAALVQLLAAFFLPLTADQQTGLNAVAAAAAGLFTAFWVRRDGSVASVLGLAQALIACGVGFGLDLSAEGQAAIMASVNIGVAMFVRTQATAPVNANGSRQV